MWIPVEAKYMRWLSSWHFDYFELQMMLPYVTCIWNVVIFISYYDGTCILYDDYDTQLVSIFKGFHRQTGQSILYSLDRFILDILVGIIAIHHLEIWVTGSCGIVKVFWDKFTSWLASSHAWEWVCWYIHDITGLYILYWHIWAPIWLFLGIQIAWLIFNNFYLQILTGDGVPASGS